MGLHTIYGVNGVGKDTVANELVCAHENTFKTSESRLLMFILGIADNYDTTHPVTRDHYKLLEETPQTRMIEIEKTDYRYLIEEFARSETTVLILSHLVFALYLDKKIKFLDERTTPDWYLDANESLIQLIAPSQTIYGRRIKDEDTRDRGQFTIEDIDMHQQLCGRRWEKIAQQAEGTFTVTATIENICLTDAVEQTARVIYERT